jgi:hypothetical protein
MSFKVVFPWFLVAALLCSQTKINGQSINNSQPVYGNLSAGFGMLYGGLGGNLELGIGHFAGHLSLGHATRRIVDQVTISPTTNWGVGLRYYFDLMNENIFPRIGLGYGWITNYYNEAIGTQTYDQSAYGLLLHLGIQFYSAEGFVFSFDAGLGSRYTITNIVSHPHFYPIYIRPNIGIGYDLSRIWKKSSNAKTIKNRAINPFEG